MNDNCVTAANKADVLGSGGLYRELVHIKAWDKSVWLRELTLAERLEVEEYVKEGEDAPRDMELFLQILLRGAETPERTPLFDADDLEQLRGSSGAAVVEVGMELLRINQMRGADQSDLKKT